MAASTQAPSWPDADPERSGEEAGGPVESRAVVCDINKEMLNVGKQKAESKGIHTGMFFRAIVSRFILMGSFH